MNFSAVLVLLLGLVAFVYTACVSPPSDLQVCVLPSTARVPQEYANTNADRQLQSYFFFLQSIKAVPTDDCALAYIDFACSQAYPRCAGDAASGLGLPVNTCYFQCSNFVEKCRGQLIGVERPDCGTFSVSPDCTAIAVALPVNENGAAAISASIALISLLVVLVL